MTDRPILFSAPMVRALLNGRKTQTRRIIKEPKCGSGLYMHPVHGLINSMGGAIPKPPCMPKDRLWVKESHSFGLDISSSPLWFWADGNPVSGDFTRPKPSIHMPRWASRLTLNVKNVHAERLQDISEDDARSEGASFHDGGRLGHSGWRHDWKDVHPTACSSFRRLWNDINGKDAWDANPWVWVIEFDVLRGNIDGVPG